MVREAFTLETTYIENRGDGTFELRPLPHEAQLAPVYGLFADDVDGDGHQDVVLGGNFFTARPEIGSLMASYGLYLRGDGAGGLTPVSARASGLSAHGQVRDIQPVRTRQGVRLFIAKNDAAPQVVAY